ncbi:zinc finger protein 366-like [Ctenocephalides felis]|uniref:zinc finger protein 366-like n=1 Tax=Ctenocephalides felis TaxID=7515 RepID=UPI000E6E2BEF|nr:zinc finger protein 366-like [Ctenocephalides felis]
MEDEFDDSDVIVKSEWCSEDDDTCLERFMYSEVTIEEEVKHELVETSTYECDICSRSFAETHHLKEHMIEHMPNNTKENPFKSFQMRICCKAFDRLSVLKRHMLIHSSNMKSHMLMHSGVRPHECNICKKTFTKSNNLKRHMLLHSRVLTHKCNICNKKFTQSGHLKKHMLIHNENIPVNVKYVIRNLLNQIFEEAHGTL